MKSLIWLGMIVGSFVGGYVPVIWGVSSLSFTSLLGSGVGGTIGIYLGYKAAQRYGI